VLSSTYQTTHGPLLSTLYEPLPKHLISVLGPRSAIERAEIGNSRPTVVRACALLDRAGSRGAFCRV